MFRVVAASLYSDSFRHRPHNIIFKTTQRSTLIFNYFFQYFTSLNTNCAPLQMQRHTIFTDRFLLYKRLHIPFNKWFYLHITGRASLLNSCRFSRIERRLWVRGIHQLSGLHRRRLLLLRVWRLNSNTTGNVFSRLDIACWFLFTSLIFPEKSKFLVMLFLIYFTENLLHILH